MKVRIRVRVIANVNVRVRGRFRGRVGGRFRVWGTIRVTNMVANPRTRAILTLNLVGVVVQGWTVVHLGFIGL